MPTKRKSPASRQATPESLLPLRPSVFAMLMVINRGHVHGYGIMKRLNENGGAGGLIGPGTLYRTLKEMRDLGLVEYAAPTAANDQDDERRSYYALTPFGRKVVVAEANRIARLMREGQLSEILRDEK